ncbi:hypothetical protein FRC04_007355 [Tulasnella sp. 424]|nr:hypothetical protein FRC04_007355 [Tulasnella sp. 424]KAG8971587.1 hypothetical protein FRC05_010933 [Tulasnella sp. 425]
MAGSRDHIPVFPSEFGGDNGEYFFHYDKVQDQIDDEVVERLKANLDGVLVFAGLFAGVNTAFIALTVVLMKPDPLDDITTLLQQLVQGWKSAILLPSMFFTPSGQIMVINSLFALSLSATLFTSFFAVLGKQWLMYYRVRKGAGFDQQRWKQLGRSLGAERLGFVSVLEIVLPVSIQTTLVIFTIGFVLFLRTLSPFLSNIVLVPLVVATFLSIVTVVASLRDPAHPFKAPAWAIFLRLLLVASATSLFFRRVKMDSLLRSLKRLGRWEWMSGPAHRDGRVDRRDGVEVIATGVYSRYDEEKGNAEIDAKVRSDQTSLVLRDASHGQTRGGKERWRSLVNTTRLLSRGESTSSNAGIWSSFQEFRLGRQIENERALQVESIARVMKLSEDRTALYHAALNLRPITDLKLLELVCGDQRTIRALREYYFEAIREVEKKYSPANQKPKLLRDALAFGTAFFHVAFSAASFDEFTMIIGVKPISFPEGSSEMSSMASRVVGETCRYAQSSVKTFMNLQSHRLGAQPQALTSTTLAAHAFWYSINGIPHSQDDVYGDKFREALAASDVSWAGLGLLASVSNNVCQFHDARKRKPFGMKELNWCREAFLLVRDTYNLSEPTQALADAIHISLTSGKNLETNATLFKFAWRLFTRDDDGDTTRIELGGRALAAAPHLICAIETAVRSSKGGRKHTKYAEAREMCFKAMIEYMGPSGGEMKALKGVLWRHKLTLMTANAYMRHIMGLVGPVNKEENARAKEFMEKVREAQIQNVRTALAMGKEYTDAKRAFEEVFLKFDLQDSAVKAMFDDSASTVSMDEPPNDLSS